MTHPLSEHDRDERRRAREEADRRYNEALTRLDAAISTSPPPLPNRLPPLDRSALSALRSAAPLTRHAPAGSAGWRGRLSRFVWRIVAPVAERQDAINAATLDLLSRSLDRDQQTRDALNDLVSKLGDHLAAAVAFQSRLVQFLQQITAYVDTKDREMSAATLADPHEQIRRIEAALGAVQQREMVLKREMERLIGGPERAALQTTDGRTTEDVTGRRATLSGSPSTDPLNAYKYVGFEAEFRGSEDAIRTRLSAYVPLFAGARDVLDVGCGRGELLDLLRQQQIAARGVELNHEMAEVCRARGLAVDEVDAVGYLDALPDHALGGLFAGQVVEHLEPAYLMRFLELAYHKLRPGSKIVLETINVDCWSAFFGPYLRDITHVRPLPSATLRFLLEASGFQRVAIRASAPVADSEKFQPLSARAALPTEVAPLVQAFNANVERLNALLFTHLDYAAIGERL